MEEKEKVTTEEVSNTSQEASEINIDVQLVKETFVEAMVTPYKTVETKQGMKWFKFSLIIMAIAALLFAANTYYSIDKSLSDTFGDMTSSDKKEMMEFYEEILKADDLDDDLEYAAEGLEDTLSELGINISIEPKLLLGVFKLPYNYLSNGFVFFIKLALFPILYFAAIIGATYLMLKACKQTIDIKEIPSRLNGFACFYAFMSLIGIVVTLLDISMMISMIATIFVSLTGWILLYESLKNLFVNNKDKYCYIFICILLLSSIVAPYVYFWIIF